jgi:osmotically-inducible protein OsmY
MIPHRIASLVLLGACLGPGALPSIPQILAAAPAPAAPGEREGRSPVSDAEIRGAIEAILRKDAQLSESTNLGVACAEGTVTLTGSADSLSAVRQAERRAGEVRGVLEVRTRVAIRTAGIPDAQILLEIERGLAIPSFRGDRISVAVRGGHVRLTGTTATYARKLLADRIAAEVPGAVEVVNDLRVAAPPEGDDAELARRIRLLLTAGLTPVPGTFGVEVREGRVTLSGTVSLLAHSVQAERLALSVGGVQSVENRITIDPGFARGESTIEVQP